ncbi:DNA-entry nuclease [Bacillus sp. FJAT-26390]|nr:DNA-entry nuclease [Bacillus sp. FJAT-26390]
MKSLLTALLTLSLILSGCGALSVNLEPNAAKNDLNVDATIHLPTDRYPETVAHIAAAIKAGASAICTIDRNGADANRDASLNGIATKKGFDRDEWPMAMCKEGGNGAHIAYVSPKDNRGAGSWIGNQLAELKDGTRVLFVVGDSAAAAVPAATDQPPVKEETVYYANCAAAKEAGAAPLHKGDPGYSVKLDRDKDGVACS